MIFDYRDVIQEILIDEVTLQRRIAELGSQIDRDYAGKYPILVCVLRGGVLFLTDLIRNLTVPHIIDFMAVSSYGAGARQSTGQVRINFDLGVDIYDRDVLLVEDIIDSGYTLKKVIDMLQTRHPRSVKVCALLDKAARRQVAVPIDYLGFSIPDKFVFGYGLDLDEYYRNLPFIAAVDPRKYRPPE